MIKLLLVLLSFPVVLAVTRRPKQVNFLLLISDDLRADVAPYSHKYASFTPNINKFAETSLTFEKAYASQALCGPSRNSFLSGRRPDLLRSWNFLASLRKFSSNMITLPEAFRKQAGYETIAVGKVNHLYEDIGDDAKNSWSRTILPPGKGDGDRDCPLGSLWCPCDGPCVDITIAKQVSQLIKFRDQNSNKLSRPWFIAAGFRRPHAGEYWRASYFHPRLTQSIRLRDPIRIR